MQRAGSLSDFMEIDMSKISFAPRHRLKLSYQIDKDRKDEEGKKRRYKKAESIVSSYVASDKSRLMKGKGVRTEASVPQKRNMGEYDRYFRKKEWMSENKFILFPITDPKLCPPEIKLKRGQRLLRAASQVKREEESTIIKKKEYEEAYEGLAKSLTKLNNEDIFVNTVKNRNERNIVMKLYLPKQREGGISNEKRVEFERCLDWAKRRKKHGEYYEDQLGKRRNVISLQKSTKKRKQLLKQIKKQHQY